MKAAIVDYGICNMFSVKHACEKVGIEASITDSAEEILEADLVILPGVGAFGDAMSALRRLDLIEVLKDAASSRKPFIGICLGLQLLMSESEEFGPHQGLNILPGAVKRFENSREKGRALKVPHMGWNRIHCPEKASWSDTPLEGVREGEHVYFVHSYYVRPENENWILTTTPYGDQSFCSGIHYQNIFGFQFHPERSGPVGMRIFQNFLSLGNRSTVQE